MTTQAAAPARRRRAALAITLGVVVVLLIGFFLFAGLYTDALWFGQLGFQNVLYTEWLTIAGLFLAGFLTMAVPVALSVQLAYRLRPVYAKLTAQLDRYQQVIEPLRRFVMFGVPAVIGLFAAVSAAARWQPVLLLLHAQPVGRTDPQFGLDVGFYLFTLPALHGLVGFLSAVLVVCIIGAVATSYLYGAVRIVGRDVRVSKAARIQIAVTVAVFLVLQAVSLFLDRFTSLYDQSTGRGLITGASYADVNAVIPGRLILAAIALLVALLFVVTAIIGRWRLPLIGSALLVVSSIVVGSIFPWAMYNLQVRPNEAPLERPYIARAITATRQAYNVAGTEQIAYDATTDAQPGALRSDAQTTANIRIIDPAVVSPTFGQFQQFRQYYRFPTTLDVDRYTIDGTSQDAVVAVRELNLEGLSTRNAYNDAFVYTHGYGLVAAYGNQRSDTGAPVFFESNIPSTGDLDIQQPRIYFGENSPTFSVVGAPDGTRPVELDYATGTTGNSGGSSQQNTTYSEQGGPSVGSLFNRLVYALKFSSDQILLSDAVNSRSQILYDRNPALRVQKVAPYLTIDQDPYPSVVNGRVVWIVDGYTTSTTYPYSRSESLSGALANTNAPVAPYITDQVNYMRNSVKATVDAYTGKVTLYAWEPNDPVLKAWRSVFPDTVQPMSNMSAQLMSHVRYPEDLFRVQRSILAQYHVTDPADFFTGDDFWRVSPDPSDTTDTANTSQQRPYYLTMRLPGQTGPSYSIYSSYIPNQQGADARSILTGYLAADANAGSTQGQKRAGYGQLRLLTLPKDVTVPGPGQVQGQFNSNTTIRTQLSLLNLGGSGGSRVVAGNLLTIPVSGGLLYVQPTYVESTSGSRYPLLRKVLTAFGTDVAIGDTLGDSLDTLFGGDSGTSTPDGQSGSGSTGSGSTGSGSTGNGSTGSGTGTSTALRSALNDARDALQARQQAYADNDLVAAAQADQDLQAALQRAIAADG